MVFVCDEVDWVGDCDDVVCVLGEEDCCFEGGICVVGGIYILFVGVEVGEGEDFGGVVVDCGWFVCEEFVC